MHISWINEGAVGAQTCIFTITLSVCHISIHILLLECCSDKYSMLLQPILQLKFSTCSISTNLTFEVKLRADLVAQQIPSLRFPAHVSFIKPFINVEPKCFWAEKGRKCQVSRLRYRATPFPGLCVSCCLGCLRAQIEGCVYFLKCKINHLSEISQSEKYGKEEILGLRLKYPWTESSSVYFVRKRASRKEKGGGPLWTQIRESPTLRG